MNKFSLWSACGQEQPGPLPPLRLHAAKVSWLQVRCKCNSFSGKHLATCVLNLTSQHRNLSILFYLVNVFVKQCQTFVNAFVNKNEVFLLHCSNEILESGAVKKCVGTFCLGPFFLPSGFGGLRRNQIGNIECRLCVSGSKATHFWA